MANHHARRAATVLFLALLLAGLVALVLRLAGDGPALAARLRAASWLDGSVTATLDRQIGKDLPRSAALDGWLHGLLYAATGDTGPQVRQGCPGWLFLSEETASTPHGERHLQQRLRLARLLQTDLQRRGVTLVMLAVPDKVELAHSQLCGLAVSDQARGRRQAWLAASAALPIRQTDLHAGWPAPAYWRTDSHWDRGGATFAAARLAATIATLSPALPPSASTIVQQPAPRAPVARIGDLAKLAGLDRNAPPFAPPPDTELATTLEITRGGTLLDDVAAPPVLLAGSSYSLNSGFIDALQLALGQEVSQQSRTGSGFAGSLLDVLQHPQRLEGVKVLVWEWPLRVLYQPLTDAETAYLKQQGAAL